MFELNNAKELYFMTQESDAKFEEKLMEFGKFSPEHSTKVSKLGL